MTKLQPLGLALALTLGCTSSNPPAAPVDASATNDLGASDASDAAPSIDLGEEDVPPPPPAWPRELQPARVMGEARGFHAVRAIVHAHS
ncbi:MAG: hypothetical protein KA978_26235, partial [Deltaproteobacteria bacterium]|nr:hypothetical protein [Deltaproteobacteria bacterium]